MPCPALPLPYGRALHTASSNLTQEHRCASDLIAACSRNTDYRLSNLKEVGLGWALPRATSRARQDSK